MAKQGAPAPRLQTSPSGGALGGLLGGLLAGQTAGAGQPGLASMLDMNGDGNPLDDILRMVGKAMR